MPLTTRFRLVRSPTEVLRPVTKFGGRPFWTAEPRWPLDPETGQQMLFLGQIALDEEMFPGGAGTMVHMFVGDGLEPVHDEGMAMVVQAGPRVRTIGDEVEFVPEHAGPSVYELDGRERGKGGEYRAEFEPSHHEDVVALRERYTPDDLSYDFGFRFARPELAGNKLGGQPLYIGQLATPPEPFVSDEWLPLLQLAPTEGYWTDRRANFYDFHMDLGEFGILTVFLSRDHTRTTWCVQNP